MAQSILVNAAVASGGRLTNAALGIIITGALTRFFGPALFGTYTLLLSYGALLQLAADFGLYLTLTREIARAKNEHDIISHVISLRLALATGIFIGGLLALRFIPALSSLGAVFVMAAAGLLCQSISQLFMGIYQKHGTVWRATAGDLLGRLAQLAAIILLGRLLGGLLTMMSSFSVGALVALVIHYALLPNRLGLRLKASWSTWRSLIKTSWPLGAMLLLNAVYFRIDTLILSLFRSAAEVGQYGLAYRIIESGLFFPAMFGGLLLPQLSQAWHAQRYQRCAQLLTEAIRVLLFAGAFCMLVLVLFATPAVTFIAGPAFIPAGPLLQILSAAYVIMFFGNLFGFALVAINRQRVLLYLYAVLAVVNTIANYLFIPVGGAYAAAVTTVVTEGAAMVIAAYTVRRSVRFDVSGSTLMSVGISILCTASVALLLYPRLHFIGVLAIITPFYIVVSLLSGALSRQHLGLLVTKANL